MKAIIITKPGPPDVLQLHDRPLPAAAPRQVLIKVEAAGVNRPDIMQRQGIYPPPANASPDIPGLEISGTVVETGTGVTRFKKGDLVCALTDGGGYAAYCAVREEQCLRIPKGISLLEAASLPETYFTVWSNVFDQAGLLPGESLLVHGGSSGIGAAAIQLAKALGCKVYTTGGSEDKLEFCRQLGADHAINYKEKDFQEVILHTTQGQGVNVVLDMIGGAYTPKNIGCLANEGRLTMINCMNGRIAEIDLVDVMRKRLVLTGSMLRPRDAGFKGAIANRLEAKVWGLFESGKLKPTIYKVFKPEEAAAAHSLMESSEHMGKIMIDFSALT